MQALPWGMDWLLLFIHSTCYSKCASIKLFQIIFPFHALFKMINYIPLRLYFVYIILNQKSNEIWYNFVKPESKTKQRILILRGNVQSPFVHSIPVVVHVHKLHPSSAILVSPMEYETPSKLHTAIKILESMNSFSIKRNTFVVYRTTNMTENIKDTKDFNVPLKRCSTLPCDPLP